MIYHLLFLNVQAQSSSPEPPELPVTDCVWKFFDYTVKDWEMILCYIETEKLWLHPKTEHFDTVEEALNVTCNGAARYSHAMSMNDTLKLWNEKHNKTDLLDWFEVDEDAYGCTCNPGACIE